MGSETAAETKLEILELEITDLPPPEAVTKPAMGPRLMLENLPHEVIRGMDVSES